MDLRVLKSIGNGVPVKKAMKLGIDYRSLIAKGLVSKVVKTESKFLIPADAPRWAIKYKFLRKKHGITENTIDSQILVLTEKAKRILMQSRHRDDDEDEPAKPPAKKEVREDEPAE